VMKDWKHSETFSQVYRIVNHFQLNFLS